MSEKSIEVGLWEVAKLIPYDKNAKRHSDEQVQQLASMIERYGFTQPIVIDPEGVIVAGHGRRLASLYLKLDKVPVRILRNYTKEELDAARLADNRVASTDYDAKLLAEELEALSAIGYEVENLGFSAQELEFLAKPDQELDESLFIDDVSVAVEDHKQENTTKTAETDAAAAPVADALGFKRVTVSESRKIRSFMSRLEDEHGVKGVSALLAHITEIESLAA